MLRLTSNHVVVLDEAGMVPTKLMAKLIDQVERSGAKLVLVGDAAQLQAIGAGGPFKSISERVGQCQLTQIRRQKEQWRRDTVEQFSRGEAKEALIAYAAKGQLHVTKSREEALSSLVERWKADNGIENSKDVLLLASLNAEVKAINRMCQEERRQAGKLGESKIYINNEWIHERDRVMLCKNSKALGVKNGFTGEVVSLDEITGRVSVKLDRDGRKVEIWLGDYGAKNLKLGYASSVHKSQGRTVEHCHVLMGGHMSDLHLGYVQASRSRESTHLFIDQANAGPGLKDAIRSLSRARYKDLAHDVVDQAQRVADEQAREQQRLAQLQAHPANPSGAFPRDVSPKALRSPQEPRLARGATIPSPGSASRLPRRRQDRSRPLLGRRGRRLGQLQQRGPPHRGERHRRSLERVGAVELRVLRQFGVDGLLVFVIVIEPEVDLGQGQPPMVAGDDIHRRNPAVNGEVADLLDRDRGPRRIGHHGVHGFWLGPLPPESLSPVERFFAGLSHEADDGKKPPLGQARVSEDGSRPGPRSRTPPGGPDGRGLSPDLRCPSLARLWASQRL